MKKFTNQFLKLSMIFATINAVNLVGAYAQERNYDEINSQNTRISSTQSNQRKSKIVKFLFETDFMKIRFPKNRRLSNVENDQKELLKCVVKFVEKRKGLYEGPAIINGILYKAMESDKLTADSFTLSKTTEECWDAYNSLTNFKKRETKPKTLEVVLAKLPETSSHLGEAKAARFIISQYKNEQRCIANEVNATAAPFGFGVGAGVSHLKCLSDSGIVRNYVGPSIHFVGGFGAKVEYSRLRNFDVAVSDIGAASVGVSGLSIENVVIGVGAGSNATYTGYSESEYDRESQMLGVAAMTSNFYFTANLRFINGARNWSFVLDQLK